MIRSFSIVPLLFATPFLTVRLAAADDLATERYLLPPKPVMDAVLAPWWQNVTPGPISPDGSRYLILERPPLATLADMGRPHMNLGGLQIDTVAVRDRSLSTRGVQGLRIFSIKDRKETRVALPAGAKIGSPAWSPDGRTVAFLMNADNGTWLYVADAMTGKARPATKRPLKPTLDTGFDWVGDRLVAVVMPAGNAKPPVAPLVAPTPFVEVSDQKTHKFSTYPSLLASPYEASLLEYYATGQLAVIDPARGTVAEIGKPAMIDAVTPSPDGGYFRVTTLEKPFSYLVPTGTFGRRETVWDGKGATLVELQKRPLLEGRSDPNAPQDPTAPRGIRNRGRATGPTPQDARRRAVEWRPDGMGLGFLQVVPAERGANSQTPRKDRVMQWLPPFRNEDQRTVYTSDDPITSVRYSEDAKTLFLTTTASGRTRLSMVHLPDGKPVTLVETRPNDDESASLVTRSNKLGIPVVVTTASGDAAFLSGSVRPEDPLKTAPKPYLDRVDLATGKRTRVFESKAEAYETPTMLDPEGKSLLVVRQSSTQVPDAFLVDAATKAETRLTNNRDYLPDLTNARRETLTVTRPDGVKFQVKVTMSPTATKAPAFFWFYPREYETQAAYDRTLRTFNKNLFPTVSGANKQILVRQGYVVVEPDCPIVGPTGRMNDTYVSQLRNNLAAVIDELDRRGWIDRQRLALGGHSYGAFSTANAMIATPYFKAGIAGDGNYNRSLTPFGFQNEGRQIWEGRETYLAMSPLLHADEINGALMMYHGMEDQNVGTDPINSQRMFAALTAMGKPVALTMYPYEDHGQIAQETVLDQWARWTAWLDKWVKNPTAMPVATSDEPAKTDDIP